jgi:hypothetical protein
LFAEGGGPAERLRVSRPASDTVAPIVTGVPVQAHLIRSEA